jgi:hypothetical protein
VPATSRISYPSKGTGACLHIGLASSRGSHFIQQANGLVAPGQGTAFAPVEPFKLIPLRERSPHLRVVLYDSLCLLAL